jgi:hypothetical protein
MASSVAELTSQLHAFAKECGMHSLPSRDDLSEAGEQQCRIIGSTLLAWLRQHSQHFLKQRIFFEKLKRWNPKPVIVFSSTLPGLLAAREIVGGLVSSLPP